MLTINHLYRMHLHLQAKPGSRKEQLQLRADGTYLLKIAAPATEGKANARIVAWLSETLGVPRSRIQIIKGETSAHKTIAIDAEEAMVLARLKAMANPA